MKIMQKQKMSFSKVELPKQMSIRQISNLYQIPEWTLRGYIKNRMIPHRRLGRKIYIPIQRFEEWLSSGDVEPDTQKINQQKKVKNNLNNKKESE